MNRIYKVIWSKVKHQYVVVSELAHSNGKQSRTARRSLRSRIAALVVCGAIATCVYPEIPAYADGVGSITIGDTTYQVVGTSDSTGKFIVDKNGNFGVLTNNASTYNGQTNLTSDDYVFNVEENGTLNAAGINIADGRLVITPAAGADQSGGISFLKGRIIMDASGDFSIKDDKLQSNVFSVDSEEGHVKTEGHIEAGKYIKTDEYIEAAGNITSTKGDIQSEKGDVLSFNNALNKEISLNEVGYNTQKISYAANATIIDSDVNVNSHRITSLADPTNNLDAANKQYVDNKILNTYTPGDGIRIEDAANDTKEISVKTADQNSGLKFDADRKMSVAVKDKAGINLDNDGLSVNAGNGLEINSEDGSLQVKTGKGLQINSDTKELEAFSSDPNIQINGTTGITLNPALENMTSINFKNSTVSISATDGINAGNKEIKGVVTKENSTNDVAVNKGYVDNAVKNATGKTYTGDQGIAVDNDKNTISVKTTGANSGLQFDEDGKMSVAVKDNSGINLDKDGLSVNEGNGLEITDTGVLQVKSADNNITVSSNGVGLNPGLTGITSIDGASVASTGNGGLTIAGVTLENNTVRANQATFGSDDKTTVVDDNGVVSKGKIQGTIVTDGTYTLSDVGAKTDIFNVNVDNKTATFQGDVVSTYDENTTYSLNDLGQKIDGLNIDGVDLDNIKGITRTVKGADKTPGEGTTSIETSTHINNAGLYVGNSVDDNTFSVNKQTGNVTGGTYNGVSIEKSNNDAVINDANINKIDRNTAAITRQEDNRSDSGYATKIGNSTFRQQDYTISDGTNYSTLRDDGTATFDSANNLTVIGDEEFSTANNLFTVDNAGNITASNGKGKGTFTMNQDEFAFGFGGNNKASLTMNDTELKLGFGVNSFTMNADGSTLDSPITFKGDDGDGDITVIDGDTITTDTLNVNTINLSGKIIDSNGTESEGTLTIRKDGYINADYTDSNGAHSHFTNDENGVNSEYTYDNTTATSTTGNISDNTGETVVGVKDQVGDNTSSVMTDGQIKDTVGDNTVTTTDEGTKFENGTGSSTNIDGGSVTVTGTDGNSTTITGDNITTGHITTDSITTGSINIVNEDGSNVHIGNDATLSGTIKDDLGNSFTYENTVNGYYSEAMDKDGNSTVTNVNADGSITHVTDKEGNNAKTNISADNINNTVSNGKNSASTNLDANGFTVTDSKSSNTATITGDDVVINTGKNNEIKLSDMGQISDIDSELQENSKFENNQTVVGAINAEADIRRNEIARIDNNIEQLDSRVSSLENRMGDVEERIDKVGAMAAAIANLRTMGYDPEAPTEIAVGVGQYKSETGLALGIFHYPNQDFMLSASISTSGDEVMGGIGATWKLGRKSAAERAKDNEERILAKAEEIKQAAKHAEVKAQADRHAQLLAEREAAGQPIRPVEEA